jgi:serine/threonine-protein kinase HipA
MNGKREEFSMDDFNACARNVILKRGRAKAIAGKVHEAVF